MADPSYNSPFERSYVGSSSVGTPAAVAAHPPPPAQPIEATPEPQSLASTSTPSRIAHRPPRLVIPDADEYPHGSVFPPLDQPHYAAAHPHPDGLAELGAAPEQHATTASTTTTTTGGAGASSGHLGGSAASKKVNWPAELSHHVSIKMASPKTLQDQGARDELTRALEEHYRKFGAGSEMDEDGPDRDRPIRFIGPSGSEVPSRANSSDGDPEERMEELRQQMEVFVDPGETDGLPTMAGGKSSEARNAKAAWGLVRSYTNGGSVFRQRKKTGFKSGHGAKAEDSDPRVVKAASQDPEKVMSADSNDGQPKSPSSPGGGIGGFVSRMLANHHDPADEVPIAAGAPSINNGGGGILSALIALQQQQAGTGIDSIPPSGATTPTSELPSRGSVYSSEDEDEEMERIKFTLKQREKRANRSMMHGASTAISNAGKSAGHALGFGHHHATGQRGHRPSSSGEQTPGRTGTHGATKLFAPPNSGHTSAPGSPGFGSFPKRRSGAFTDSVHNMLGKVGANFEDSSSRPEAARSGAGVFGGLMLSTANIAGAASPAATSLAPNATRPGYSLSRYSAPSVPTIKSGKMESSVDTSPENTTSTSTLNNSPTASPPPGEARQTKQTPPNIKVPKHKPTFSLADLTPHKISFFPGASRPNSRPGSLHESPTYESSEYFPHTKETQEDRERREWEKEKRRRRKLREKRKQQEVFITQHVAAILERQQFILKLARAFMMFGAPSHRLEAQLQATARVLEINCQVIYIPAVMLVSFGDSATHTSEVRFVRQSSGLDLGKLKTAYMIYYDTIYDKISVTDASKQLDDLMLAGPQYKLWQNMLIGGLASAFIQPSAFYGSFIDCLISIPLGALLVLVQVLVSRNDLYSSLFEIVIACINAFLAAALASTNQFCFAAVASGSVVLILPGYIVLCGSLELANRSIISGSVRLVYSILYSLFLGFGLSMGSEVYQRITKLSIAGATDYQCTALRRNAPWWRATISPYWFFFTIPCFLLLLALRNGQPLFRKESFIMVLFGSTGFVANYFSGKAFTGRSDVVSAIGSFAVGFLGNLYGKVSRGSPFVVMVPGILLQLPSGLSNGGLLEFAADSTSNNTFTSSTSYASGFSVASSLIEVAIGLTVGLFLSAAVVLGKGSRRGRSLHTF
ncbi:BZ3500_MvSof-1268-A1-R1_Chr2-3g05284 [Microbotryum saponariae]|uniref:BZ3500_MvSof-1268-A1-R1_Chr2-3g05284 protein n=1 Tax=Microbotryum saponariae TaxID=289078 RepID=A0A2X0KB89_9BASI|nr:BZ3500_MvSof-1268-A1-R1_Chr2-3g05284 [Microbotryum saponariae]SDA01115.1 BZ3501_MvSof-1269-A2-R1_Chr2-2g04957 [Microbotryum saponariae]